MRLFIALEIPGGVQERLSAAIERCKVHAPRSRWVRTENIHLTLVFLGERPEQTVPGLQQSLEDAARGVKALSLEAAGAGAFGRPSRPKVLWVGVRGDIAALSALQLELATRTQQLEERGFSPHLTLARARDPRGDRELANAVPVLSQETFGAWTAREVVLFHSSPKVGGGMTYTALARAPLT